MSIKITPDGESEWLVKLGPATLSYPHIYTQFKSREPGKTGKYGCKLLLDRNDVEQKADAKTLHTKILQMCKEKFNQSIPADKLCLRNGDQLTEDLHKFYVVSASESIRPIVVDRRRDPVPEEDGSELFYPGAKVIAVIRLWAQDSKDWGRRVNANLVSLQFHSHGPRLCGRARPKVNELYDDISDKFDDDEYAGGPTGDGDSDPGDDGFGDDEAGL